MKTFFPISTDFNATLLSVTRQHLGLPSSAPVPQSYLPLPASLFLKDTFPRVPLFREALTLHPSQEEITPPPLLASAALHPVIDIGGLVLYVVVAGLLTKRGPEAKGLAELKADLAAKRDLQAKLSKPSPALTRTISEIEVEIARLEPTTVPATTQAAVPPTAGAAEAQEIAELREQLRQANLLAAGARGAVQLAEGQKETVKRELEQTREALGRAEETLREAEKKEMDVSLAEIAVQAREQSVEAAARGAAAKESARNEEILELRKEIERLGKLIAQKEADAEKAGRELERLARELSAAKEENRQNAERERALKTEVTETGQRAAGEAELAKRLSHALQETQRDVKESKRNLAILRAIAEAFAPPETKPEPAPSVSFSSSRPMEKITLRGLDRVVSKFLVTIPPAPRPGDPRWLLLPAEKIHGSLTQEKDHHAMLAIVDEWIYIRKIHDTQGLALVKEGRTVFDHIGETTTYFLFKPGEDVAFTDQRGRVVVARYGEIKKRVDELSTLSRTRPQPPPLPQQPAPQQPAPQPPPRQQEPLRLNPDADPFEEIHDLDIPPNLLTQVFGRNTRELDLYRQEKEYRTLRDLLASLELEVKQALWKRVRRYHAHLSIAIPNLLLPEIAAEAIMDRILLNIPARSVMVRSDKQVELIRGLSTHLRAERHENLLISGEAFKREKAAYERDRQTVTEFIRQRKVGDLTRPDLRERRPPPRPQGEATESRSRVTATTRPPTEPDPEAAIPTTPMSALSEGEAEALLGMEPVIVLTGKDLVSEPPPSGGDRDAITNPTGGTDADLRLAELRRRNFEIPHEIIEKTLPQHLKGLYETHLKTAEGKLIWDLNMLTHHLERRTTDRIVNILFLTNDKTPLERAGPEFVAHAVAAVLNDNLPSEQKLDQSQLDRLIKKLAREIRRFLKRTDRIEKQGGA